MVTVGQDVSQVERQLAAGCWCARDAGGRLGPWGACPNAQAARGGRSDMSTTDAMRELWEHSRVVAGHALLRRADEAVVIGAGVVLAAAGWGHRRIAARVGRPAGTVRGWVRRMRERAEVLRLGFTELLVAVDPDPVVPDPGGSALTEAVAVIAAAATATVRRWGAAVSGLSAWELAAAVTSGGLLTPTGLVVSINTSCPW